MLNQIRNGLLDQSVLVVITPADLTSGNLNCAASIILVSIGISTGFQQRCDELRAF